MDSDQEKQFYNKLAKKFGGYRTGTIHQKIFTQGSPEAIFFNQILKLRNKHKQVLDIGCADGRFTLNLSPYFKHIIGVDIALEMLHSANEFKSQNKTRNVTFQEADAASLPYPDDYFDLAYSRRGPSPYEEIGRVIRAKGYYLEICIGEKDAQKLKEVFRRGQGFSKWDNPVLQDKTQALQDNGFIIGFSRDYFYQEFFPDIKNFDLFLQGCPIFMDYDSDKDKGNLTKYINISKSNQGIQIERHRVIIIAQKNT